MLHAMLPRNFPKIDESSLARLDSGVTAIESAPAQIRWLGHSESANLHAAAIDLARTSARRAERRMVGSGGAQEKVSVPS